MAYEKLLNEIYAVISLKYLWPEYRSGFRKSESPDWINEEMGLGMEVSQALLPEDGQAESVIEKYLGCTSAELPENVYARYGERLHFYNDRFWAILPDERRESDWIRKAKVRFDEKLNKLNTNYIKLPVNSLYLYLHPNVTEKVNPKGLFDYMKHSQMGREVQFDLVFLNSNTGIHVCDFQEDEISTIPLPAHAREFLDAESARLREKHEWPDGMILDSVPGKYGRPKVERKSTGKDKSDNQSTPVQVDTRNRLERQMAFALELDKEKLIGRQNYLSDGQRKENDAEHAWHLAIMTLLLSEYANEPIDVLHTVAMVLMHDVVEIDAGDTYAYDENGKASQAEREMKAAKRIYNMLPEDQARKYMDLWLEFEEQKTPEARFARTMDNIQPLILNVAANGRSWLENGIHLSQVLGRNRHTASGSEELWQHAFNNLIKPSVDEGWLKNP